jgi:hypothetical protein
MLGEYLSAGSGITKGLWHLNGNSNDSSGNGNNGTDTNITYVNGKFGQCANFNGSSSGIYTNDAGFDWIEYNQAMTVSAWVKFGVSSYTDYILQGIVTKIQLSSPCPGLTIGLETRDASEANLQFVMMNNNTTTGKRIVTYADDNFINYYNTWKHIVVTYSGNGSYTGVNFYIDGVLATKKVIADHETNNGSIQNAATLNIGYRKDGASTGGFFNGSIDEVIVENRAWTAEQVKKYHTYSKGRFGII